MPQGEKGQHEISKKVAEYIIYNKLFIIKISNPNYDGKTFIVTSGATSNMIKLEENIKKLKMQFTTYWLKTWQKAQLSET